MSNRITGGINPFILDPVDPTTFPIGIVYGNHRGMKYLYTGIMAKIDYDRFDLAKSLKTTNDVI